MGKRFNAYVLVIVSLMISVSMMSCTPTKTTRIESPAASGATEEASVESKIHLPLFDADCGGIHDSIDGTLNTQTRFSLLGGINVFTRANVNKVHPSEEELMAGNLIKRMTFGQDAALDNVWSLFATVVPSDGEKVGDMYIFKLVVEGLAGNDGNVYDVSMSLDEARNVPVPGLTAMIPAPTIRLAEPNAAVEMRFYIPPGNKQITVYNFDAALAKVTLETAFRTITMGSSGQGVLSETTSLLDPMETDRLGALVFHGDGEESPNDATFYVKDRAGRHSAIVCRKNHDSHHQGRVEKLGQRCDQYHRRRTNADFALHFGGVRR